ncbi:hypothetical protein [Erythrobacter ani]|uniref:Uncharacterized protein n=1 Tax=Erythrobacter ani TaxID=2827235 RepID=A0ABS6SPU0_9SPHN|nr:hypothetical protein [Erythrobacter ani]MBV7267059.1 hypothetical protein [Erythrobacter ani]
MTEPEKPADNPFLSKDDLIAHLKGQMFPKDKHFAPSLVMWGDAQAEVHDVDRLEHMSKPDAD